MMDHNEDQNKQNHKIKLNQGQNYENLSPETKEQEQEIPTTSPARVGR